MQPDLNVVRNQLIECYREATQKDGLIDFVTNIRNTQKKSGGKYSVTPSDLETLFSNAVWKETKTGSGHRKLKNVITKIVIEYSNHDNSGGIDPGAAQTISDNVQRHLNILCNDIFQYTFEHWKTEPDYKLSAERYTEMANKPRMAIPRRPASSA